MFLCGEDDLSRAVLQRLVLDICGVADPIVLGPKNGGISHIVKCLPKYFKLAESEFVILLIDLDSGECEPSCRRKFFEAGGVEEPTPDFMVFGIAKREVESWLLADVQNLASFLNISSAKIDPNSETNTADPKEYLVNLAKRSRNREKRQAIVPLQNSKNTVGLGYNSALIKFVVEHWDHEAASANSISLTRMRSRIEELA